MFPHRVHADFQLAMSPSNVSDGYYTNIDRAGAQQPHTILALDFDEKQLEPRWGAPLRLRIPTKLGFKSAKNLEAMEFNDKYPGGCWETQGDDLFAGLRRHDGDGARVFGANRSPMILKG